jgi:hypothetical protein
MAKDLELLAKALIAVAIMLMLISFGQQCIWHLGLIHKPIWLFDADVETSFPTWYSVATLFLVAIALILVARQEYAAKTGKWIYWAVLAAGFGLMSADEQLEIHERAFSPETAAMFHLPPGSVEIMQWFPVPVLAVVGFAFARFVFSMPTHTRNGLILAGVIYVAGIVGVELVVNTLLGEVDHTTFEGALLVTAEESFEQAGVLVMLVVTMRHWLELLGERTAPVAAKAGAAEPAEGAQTA